MEARAELGSAEEALAAFRRSNVRIANSPQLQLEQSRLERNIQSRSVIYDLLARQYEVARIEEKRDTPTFSVVDPPKPPVRKYRPQILVNMVVAVLGAVVLRITVALLPGLRRELDREKRAVLDAAQ